jgi:hypothetical protein
VGSDTKVITASACTQVEGLNLVSEITVYPNPFNDVINITSLSEANSTQVEIYNHQGQKVYSENLSSNTAALDLSVLKKGMYLLRVTQDDQRIVLKLVKQ